jgi:hypothetical protein
VGQKMTEGYLFLCLGKSYIDDALDLIETLRAHLDLRPVDIVVLPEDEDYAVGKQMFAHIIVFDLKNDPLLPSCMTRFERFCLVPRLRLNNFIKYHFTLVLDVDVLCMFETELAWKYLKEINQGVTMLGSTSNPKWHWGFWQEVCSNLCINCYETHGGLFFINIGYKAEFENVLEYAEECFKNYDRFGMKKMYQDGRVDEPCFAYAFNKVGYKPVNFSDFPIMTFNLKSRDEIPSKKLTEEFQACFMQGFIPFVHMFCKNKTREFKRLKKNILNVAKRKKQKATTLAWYYRFFGPRQL